MKIITRLFIVLFLCFACGKTKSNGENAPSPSGNPETEGSNTNERSKNARMINSSNELPECKASEQGLLFYIASSNEFVVCNADEWMIIDLKGPAGPSEASEPSGTKASGCYVQSSNQYIGMALAGCGLILFSDGIAARFDGIGRPTSYGQAYGSMRDGGGATIPNANSFSMQCGFTSTDCSGSCYATLYYAIGSSVNASNYTIQGLVKNEGYYTGSKWVRSTGQETNVGPIAFGSYIDDLGCHSASWNALAAFPVTTPWTPPVPLNVPLGPIYVGLGQ